MRKLETINQAAEPFKSFLKELFDESQLDIPIKELVDADISIAETVQDVISIGEPVEGMGWLTDLSHLFIYRLVSDLGGPGWFDFLIVYNITVRQADYIS